MPYSKKTHVILLRNDEGEWKEKTDEVSIIVSDPDDSEIQLVHFKKANENGQKIFSYLKENVVKLENPTVFNPNEYYFRHSDQTIKGLYIACKFTDPKKVYPKTYWSFSFKNSNDPDVAYEGKDVVRRKKQNFTLQNDPGEYLRTMAYFLGYPIRSKAKKEIILAREMEKTLASKDKPLFDAFLNPRRFSNIISEKMPSLIFPYGINSSQLTAVRNAFSRRVSIIQGPPGTGKTQTILNILANIVIQGKTAMVVAGANSAIDNILEKLNEGEDKIGFIAARLGNIDKREEFFKSIKEETIICPDNWNCEIRMDSIDLLVNELTPLLNKNVKYYQALHSDDVNKRGRCKKMKQNLDANGFTEKVESLSELSMKKFKAYLYERFNEKPRSRFEESVLSTPDYDLNF